jgi:urease accessory protein
MTGWEARLALSFARRGEKSLLAYKSHHGPLVVQKMLHPEGPGVCQAIVVHPPGGIAGGDRLTLDLALGRDTHAQLTTPGAAKWYRSAGPRASQMMSARVAAGATLEWLPQETIVFCGAHADLATRIALEGDATYIGWDIVSLGRAASGERFDRGQYRQRIELVRDGALLWAERTSLSAGDRVLVSPAGLNGLPMFGTFVAAARSLAGDLLSVCRNVPTEPARGIEGAITCLPGVLIARCRGSSPEAARRWFAALWQVVRPALIGRAAVPPRIWNT